MLPPHRWKNFPQRLAKLELLYEFGRRSFQAGQGPFYHFVEEAPWRTLIARHRDSKQGQGLQQAFGCSSRSYCFHGVCVEILAMGSPDRANILSQFRGYDQQHQCRE